MFKSSISLKKADGFTLVELLVTVSILSMSVYFFIHTKQNSTTQNQNIKIKNQELILSEYIESELAYLSSCMGNLQLSNAEIINTINNKQGPLVLLAPNGSQIKSNEFNSYLNLKINKFTIKNIEMIKNSFGYRFYTGDIYLEIDSSTTNGLKYYNVGSLNFLINDLGIAVACSSAQNLQDLPEYKAAEAANL